MKYRAFVSSVLAVTAVTAMTQAAIVSFTYSGSASSPTLFATGSIDVTGTAATLGSVTISGSASMDGFYTLVPGAGSNASFIWDSFFDVSFSTQYMTNGGLLFVNGAGDQINIWGNSPVSHSLYGHTFGNPANSYSPADDNGTFAIVPAPGALALLGLAGLVGARRRRA